MSCRELPTVSVVIPTRNRPSLLRRSIRDVVAQTYGGPIEIIVVADQEAPDTSLRRDGRLRRIRVIANTRTPGLAGARNTGILAASGDLIGFCDDDDEWLPGKLDAQVRALQANGSPAIMACGIFVRRAGRSTVRIPDESGLDYRALLEDRVMEVNPCTLIVERSILIDEIGLVDERLPGSYGEDYEWLLRASKVLPIKVVAAPLVVIHWGTGSFFAERWATIDAAIDHLVASHPDLRTSARGYARLCGQQAVARAGRGQRRRALLAAARTARLNAREPRWVVAALGAAGLVPVHVSLRVANRFGRGI